MDDEPRDDQWWLPWHWTGQQWIAAVLAWIAFAYTSWTLLPEFLEWVDERDRQSRQVLTP